MAENRPHTSTAGATALELPGQEHQCPLDDVLISSIGEPAAWLDITRQGDDVVLRPNKPLPRRCTIRPAALFQQDRGFPDVSTVMGRVVFARGSTEAQTYHPFTRDPQRRLRELFVPVEAAPDDDWPISLQRWSNYQAIAKRLLAAADVSWQGLSRRDVRELVEFVPWPEPLEGCLLHALMQWKHGCGRCVIEIGSLRGRSLSMLAMALRGVKSDALLFSIDPHVEQPHNPDHVRLALRQIGEEARLVQINCPSDQACHVLGRHIASLIFIDGDHSHEQVLADFNNYRDLLAPGGCMLFHDCGFGAHNGLPDTHPGIRKVIDECVMTAPEFRPLLLAHTQFAFLKESDT